MDAETHLAETAKLKELIRQDVAELKSKAVDIKGKDYILVKDRVLFFNAQYPEGSLTTELLSAPEAEMVVFKATVSPDGKRFYTGHSQAVWGDFGVNKTAALENAETSAVGRALGMMGIGVLDSIASADEMHKANGKGRGDLSAEEHEDSFLKETAPLSTHRVNAIKEACLKYGHGQAQQDQYLGKAGLKDWKELTNDQFSAAIQWASRPSSVPQEPAAMVQALQASTDMASAPSAADKVRVAIQEIEAKKCPNCGSRLSPSKKPGWAPYCIPCWKKKKKPIDGHSREHEELEAADEMYRS